MTVTVLVSRSSRTVPVKMALMVFAASDNPQVLWELDIAVSRARYRAIQSGWW